MLCLCKVRVENCELQTPSQQEWMNNELKERADIITKDALHRPPEMCIGDSQHLRMEPYFISHNLEVRAVPITS